MGPLGFLTGVVLGSATAISVILSMVLVMFLLSASSHPALTEEYAPLGKAVVLFAILAVIAAAAFISLLRRLSWRWIAQFVMWATLVGIAWSYWPEPAV